MNRTDTVLDRILAHKREDVSARKQRVPLAELERRTGEVPSTRGFEQRLRDQVACGRPAVIAEIKKASPSKGVIRPNFDPAAIARSYADAGATCLSVLTDEEFFQGHDAYLETVRSTVPLPALRKDFLVDAYQVFESRVLGADCVLLIVAALSRDELRTLHDLARHIALDVLVEVHDEAELECACELGARLIGVNNRDLRTFETTLETTFRLLPRMPVDALVVSESGISTPRHVSDLRARGVHTFLVGEAFMRETEPGAALRRLFGGGRDGE
jgi:indole-3-glycerol phosphate synthase